jgi:UMF1 family MFS transporter
MAWGLGYVGGLCSTALVLFGLGPLEVDNAPALRWVGPITAAWFALSALPTFLLLRDRAKPKELPEGQTLIGAGFGQLLDTVRQLRDYRDLMVFFASYFFAMAGLSIVVSFAFIYGDQVIGWQASTQAAMFLLTQVTATLGALGFGWLQSRAGDKPTYALTLVIWIGAVLLIWATPTVADTIRAVTGSDLSTEQIFLGVGAMAGLCIGATQSAGRTLVAVFSPAAKVGEFFGLWGVFGKLAAIFGLLSLGFLQQQLGLETAILLCGVFFAAGLGIVAFVDMDRGRAHAVGASTER